MSNYPPGITIEDLPEVTYPDYSEMSESEKRLDRIIANHWRRKRNEALKKIKASIKPEHINL